MPLADLSAAQKLARNGLLIAPQFYPQIKRNDGHPEFMIQNNGLWGVKNSRLKLKNATLL